MKMAGPHILCVSNFWGWGLGRRLAPPQSILYTSIGIFLLCLYFCMLFCHSLWTLRVQCYWIGPAIIMILFRTLWENVVMLLRPSNIILVQRWKDGKQSITWGDVVTSSPGVQGGAPCMGLGTSPRRWNILLTLEFGHELLKWYFKHISPQIAQNTMIM